MIDPIQLLTDAVSARLRTAHVRTFGERDAETADVVDAAIALALSTIGRSDATYHDAEHTALVVQCGADILHGRQLVLHDVEPRDWMHVVLALLFHDIGYVRGVCADDRGDALVSGSDAPPIALAPGASDAALMPWHVDRGICFVRERYTRHDLVDVDVVVGNIAYTRFPVPTDPRFHDTRSWPGTCRAADLVGQMGDPRYLLKTPALFAEMRENRQDEALGLAHPDDLRASFPAFFAASVRPWIGDAAVWLEATPDGRRWLTQLHDNVRDAAR